MRRVTGGVDRDREWVVDRAETCAAVGAEQGGLHLRSFSTASDYEQRLVVIGSHVFKLVLFPAEAAER